MALRIDGFHYTPREIAKMFMEEKLQDITTEQIMKFLELNTKASAKETEKVKEQITKLKTRIIKNNKLDFNKDT